ncbi:MAG: ABC transporter permease [Pseudomonadota bacterium]
MIWNMTLLALRELRRNVLRSSLTLLGMVIGVGAVVIMVNLISGVTVQVTRQVASLGNNLFIITPGQRLGPGQSTDAKQFKEADAQAIGRDVASVSAVAPLGTKSQRVILGDKNWSTTINGATKEFLRVTRRSIKSGRNFSDGEVRAGVAACILGETVRRELFGNRNPLGGTIRIEKKSFRVVGLLEVKGQSMMGTDQDDLVVVPLRTFKRRISGSEDVNTIMLSIRDGASAARAQREIERVMRERRHITAGEQDNFNVMDTREIAKTLTGTTQVLTSLLGGVAAVSLLVGGIGIMNIMLVSVTERTREIGIRLAIGALEREVLLQFLIESVILSSFGGLLGILLAVTATAVLATMLHVPFIFNVGIVVFSFVLSATIGVVFGYFPARKAAQLDPIEALRHE